MTSALAAQRPWQEPGTKMGYHLVTYGFLVGEVVRRISGRGIGAFPRDEVTGPLGVDLRGGCHIGFPPDLDDAALDAMVAHGHIAETIASAGTACALATIYGALAGETDRLLSAAAVERCGRTELREVDVVTGRELARGLGFQPMRRGTAAFGHGGQGGSLGVADRPARLAFGSVQSYMRLGARDQRASSTVEAVYAAL